MKLDWQFAEKVQCSRQEKTELLSVIDIVVKAAEKARQEGLLALDDDVGKYPNPLQRIGMQLVVDGTDPEIIKSMLAARILSENRSGKDFLEQVIIYDSVLSIQSGDNPRIVEEKCFSYLGKDADELHQKYISEMRENGESPSVKNYMDADGRVPDCFAEISNSKSSCAGSQ